MRFIADFHIHSKYSRATSSQMNIETLSKYAVLKGIKVLGTGDFTHPLWLSELKSKLKEEKAGLFKYNNVYFMLTAEVSNIFKYKQDIKKIHNIIFAPDFGVVEKIVKKLKNYGDLKADGRPTLSLTCQDLVKLVLDISEFCLVVPAHIWTPWFSVFGANSGFDSIYECFGKESENIYSLETGLSSDPKMNWRLSTLDKYTLLSNSDSHSPIKIGREANIFDTELDYYKIIEVIKKKDKNRFLMTIEFFPEEGKYHYDGHRKCNLRFSPEQTRKNNYICPICGGNITVGVMHRVESLADRDSNIIPENAIPFVKLVPFIEIIAQVLGKNVDAPVVKKDYINYITKIGNEFEILLEKDYASLLKNMPEELCLAILNVRAGRVNILAGYDGVYGEIKLITQKEEKLESFQQMSLF